MKLDHFHIPEKKRGYVFRTRLFGKPFFAYWNGNYCKIEIEMLGVVLQLKCEDKLINFFKA